jgi:hypothetical protein
MAFSWGGLGGDILQGFGDLWSGGAISSAKAVEQTNEQNQGFAREQMAFQERMSGSAYQRAMEDMGKAGLNPMLAFSQGGASAPSGAASTAQSPGGGFNMGSIANVVGQIMGQKNAAQQTEATTQNAATNAEQTPAINAKNQAQADDANNAADLKLQQQDLMSEQIKGQRHKNREANATADQSEMDRDIAKARYEIDKKTAAVGAVLDKVSQASGAVSTARGALRSNLRTSRSYSPKTGEIIHESTNNFNPTDY